MELNERKIHQTCPFTYRWFKEFTCQNSCGYIFPQWAKDRSFTDMGNLVDLMAHPCNTMGSHEVLRIMKEKFPELYE